MGCNCGKRKKRCSGPNCGGGSVSTSLTLAFSPDLEVEIEIVEEEPMVVASTMEQIVIDIRGREVNWRPGQRKILPRKFFDNLIQNGAPVWIAS
jgi:hypothetical protein